MYTLLYFNVLLVSVWCLFGLEKYGVDDPLTSILNYYSMSWRDAEVINHVK